MTATKTRQNAPGRRWYLWLVPLIVLLALLAGLWWWKKHTTESANHAQRARLAAALEHQRSLADKLAALPSPAAEDCPPGQALRPADAVNTPQPVASTAQDVPAAAAGTHPMAGAALAERLEQATAMVLVRTSDGLSTGTGFFISPTLLVTNQHVVENQTSVLLASAALKSLRKATVIRTTRGSDIGDPDFALVQLQQGTAPGFLPATSSSRKLDPVIAAGFPGVVVENDPRFNRLLAGDTAAAPDLNLTQGIIQSLQTGNNDIPLIIHTASIAKGNSGGPLVDECGRLVGINTFINVDQSQSARIHYALQTDTLLTFLRSANVALNADSQPCNKG